MGERISAGVSEWVRGWADGWVDAGVYDWYTKQVK